MKTLLLIRHTETLHLAGRPDSQLGNDSELSDTGRAQALALAARLAGYPVELIISSLYLRAQQTAKILNERWHAKHISSMDLNEYFLRSDGAGVESVEQGFVRASCAIAPYRLAHDTIAVVSHNSILSTFMTGLLNLPFDEGKGLFSTLGRVHVLSYDWERGEQNWRIRESL